MASTSFLTRVLVALYFLGAVFAVNNTPPASVYVDKPGDGGNVTLAINVPANSTDDLYFHFHAPSIHQWAAFGFGSQMKGSLMFVVYTAQTGKTNITISPRIATGRTPPQITKDVQVAILNGTGITPDGLFMVNGYCKGCRKWSGGSINVTNEQQPMIYAVGPRGDSFASADTSAKIQQHESHNSFALNLKQATGAPGVPQLSDGKLADGGDSGDGDGDGDGATPVFPIAVHALLLLACFLVVLPGGYLFLRIFDKVWLHAGIQSLGLVTFIAGVAAGIVYNTQVGTRFSYHQVFGIVTSLLMLAAFTLGLISHQYFKKNKVSSPLMKFHRIIGPSAIGFGWITIITGFIFRGEPRRILPFAIVLIAVCIFCGSIAFLLKKRKVRKAATQTPAAHNFNAGFYQQQQQQGQGQGQGGPPSYAHGAPAQTYYVPPAGQGEGVPMQTFTRPGETPVSPLYGNFHPYAQQAGRYGQKPPNVNVQAANRI